MSALTTKPERFEDLPYFTRWMIRHNACFSQGYFDPAEFDMEEYRKPWIPSPEELKLDE